MRGTALINFFVPGRHLIESSACSSKYGSQVAPLSNKINFSVMHLNAHSLQKSLDQLNLIFESLKKSFSVIGISETWLTDCTVELVNIPRYNFIANHH